MVKKNVSFYFMILQNAHFTTKKNRGGEGKKVKKTVYDSNV